MVNSDPGDLYEADGYTSFTTSSGQMVGLQVRVVFDNGISETVSWSTNGINQSDWSVTQGPGSTFSNPFVVRNLQSSFAITTLEFHGGGTTTLFDRGVFPSTSGTANGRDFIELSNIRQNQDIEVTYFDEIRTAGSSAVGDIFAGMRINFSSGLTQADGALRFVSDTDTSINLIRLVTRRNPEPGAAVFFCAACSVLVSRRKRRLSE
ncbi:MAG: hypothetical protein AAF939_13560 [Planctomycetota bacterium]